jgi:hypothetical protein
MAGRQPMAEVLVFLACGAAGLCAGAALGLGVGWALGVRLIENGPTSGEPTGPRTTTAGKVLMGVGGLIGAPGALLLWLLVNASG